MTSSIAFKTELLAYTTQELEEKLIRLSYALSKHVREMKNGFTISHGYGDLQLDVDDWDIVANLVEKRLKRKVGMVQKQLATRGVKHG